MATVWITIPNDTLRVGDVPDITAGWPEIAEFALCFDGYAYAGSLEACKALAEWMRDDWRDIHQLPAHLSELRAALFYAAAAASAGEAAGILTCPLGNSKEYVEL